MPLSDPLEDSHFYKMYSLVLHKIHPPLIKKTSRLIATVVHNHVDILKDLLDSPEWYSTKDSRSYNLLQIAILQRNREVFDYLLSLPDYPIEYENADGRTALMVSLTGYISKDVWKGEHFAYELVKRGACIDKITSDGSTLLHEALKRGFVKVSKLLIKKGIDVNICNSKLFTALQLVDKLDDDDYTELVNMLLIYGADPTIENRYYGFNTFEQAVRSNRPNEVQEALFYYTYDELSPSEIHLEVFLNLAANDSVLFDEIINRSFKITVNPYSADLCFKLLRFVNSTRLKTIITKLETSISFLLTQICEGENDISSLHKLPLENLDVLLESTLKDQIVTVISTLDSNEFIKLLVNSPKRISEVTEYVCYLLSYGFEIGEHDFHIIYQNFGYCNLFKTVLHMDFRKQYLNYFHYVMPILLIDVSMTPQNFLDYCPIHLNKSQLFELKHHFCHPKLNSMYEEVINHENEFKHYRIPLLVELARNVFRNYFIEKFQIKTTREFYTLLNHLPISYVHKKIITFETTLYKPKFKL